MPIQKSNDWLARAVVVVLALFGFVSGAFADPGDLDPAFDPGANSDVHALAVQPDGKLLVGGYFTSIGGTNWNRIARLNADGNPDPTFNPGTGANNSVWCITPQSDGKLLVGGNFTSINGTNRNRIARLNADGSLDTTFNPGSGADKYVYSFAVQTNGKILVGGQFALINGTNRNFVARLNTNGSLDTTFNATFATGTYVTSVVLATNDKVLINGAFTGVNRPCLARFSADGGLDNTFHPGTTNATYVNSLALQTDGKLVIGGIFDTIDGTNRNNIARLNADGSLDNTFDPGTAFLGQDQVVYAVSVQWDGKILVGGTFTNFNDKIRRGVARLNSDGSLDATFEPIGGVEGGGGGTFLANVYCIARQNDGKFVIGGDFLSVNSQARGRIARFLGDSISLSMERAGDQLILSWINPAFSLQSAPLIGGAYTNIPGATSPYPIPIADAQQFFRLKSN